MFLTKKVGDFNKKESESLDFTGLKIPRDYCIVREDKWKVYYSERGSKNGLKTFETETEACEYFLRKMKRYATK